ncbi:hypothetical protein [Actinomadura rudentiformis]|uniref:Uncharacterized protein n=1 Tax=Actinomadura rudentiformis TaxID=359158 RepID=A0A6H9Z3A6_9ACTN|nr:hypothetical protein [Actinomadura rudentiformis]KAB2350203.1 hypothetical protein F8566_10455 [Actinomadura rudentiformis]
MKAEPDLKGTPPTLHLKNTEISNGSGESLLTETLYASHDQEGRLWLHWSWHDTLAAADDLEAAENKILAVLTVSEAA